MALSQLSPAEASMQQPQTTPAAKKAGAQTDNPIDIQDPLARDGTLHNTSFTRQFLTTAAVIETDESAKRHTIIRTGNPNHLAFGVKAINVEEVMATILSTEMIVILYVIIIGMLLRRLFWDNNKISS